MTAGSAFNFGAILYFWQVCFSLSLQTRYGTEKCFLCNISPVESEEKNKLSALKLLLLSSLRLFFLKLLFFRNFIQFKLSRIESFFLFSLNLFPSLSYRQRTDKLSWGGFPSFFCSDWREKSGFFSFCFISNEKEKRTQKLKKCIKLSLPANLH